MLVIFCWFFGFGFRKYLLSKCTSSPRVHCEPYIKGLSRLSAYSHQGPSLPVIKTDTVCLILVQKLWWQNVWRRYWVGLSWCESALDRVWQRVNYSIIEFSVAAMAATDTDTHFSHIFWWRIKSWAMQTTNFKITPTYWGYLGANGINPWSFHPFCFCVLLRFYA